MGMEISSGQPNISLGGNGMGGDWGIMFLAFLAMMGGGFGGWGGNRGPAFPMTGDQAPASSAQLQNLASNISDKYGELQRDIAANQISIQQVLAKQNECCCEVKQQIAGLNLENEKRFNAIETKMDQNTIQQLRDQLYAQSQSIQDLKADMRMTGVFRMPQGYTYNAGPGPFQSNPFPVPFGAGF